MASFRNSVRNVKIDSTNNGDMVEKAKRDAVSLLHLSNFIEAELLQIISSVKKFPHEKSKQAKNKSLLNKAY